MQRDYARVKQKREFEGAHGFEETHGMGATVGGFVARCAGQRSQNSRVGVWGGARDTFEGSGFQKPEYIHAEFFQVFRKDELARRMRT